MSTTTLDAPEVPAGAFTHKAMAMVGDGVADHNDYLVDPATFGGYGRADDALSAKMPALVKGLGYRKVGGNTPLDDDDKIFKNAMRAEKAWRSAIHTGHHEPEKVLKGLSPDFRNQFGAFMQAGPLNQGIQALTSQIQGILSTELGRNITLTSPLSSGFVPFDLVSPQP